jgi:hypothetical protein
MNRVTTKNIASWVQLLEPRVLRAPAAHSTPANVIWMQHTAAPRLRLGPAALSETYRVGDAWETLTYTVLWLCALIVIGLSWI